MSSIEREITYPYSWGVGKKTEIHRVDQATSKIHGMLRLENREP